MKNRVFFLIVISIFVFSCTTEVNFEPEKIEPQIVANGIMYPNEYLYVTIRKTAQILDTIPENVNNATVELWSESNLLETLTMDSSGYYSTKNYKTQAGINYTLKVYVAGFEKISATDYIPEQPDCNIEVFSKSDYTDDNSNLYYDLSFKIANSNKLFYNIYFPYNEISIFGGAEFGNLPFISQNSIILNSYRDNYKIIIDGNEYNSSELNIDILLDEHYSDTTFEKEFCNLLVVSSVSENYYKYLKSEIIKEQNSENPFYLKFSNIENGLGLFAGCNLYVDTLIWNDQVYIVN